METEIESGLTDPGRIAQAAEEIYDTNFRAEFEQKYAGEFVVIDVHDRKAYRGEFAEEALQTARKESPYGIFHLIRIGAPGAFRVSYGGRQSTAWNWTLRPAG